MDPAILNYMQSQESNQMNPETSQVSNPFDAGISRAISSARESLGLTEKQQDKAMRRSLLSFAGNMAQQPKERGFFNNFGAASRALGPAIGEYDRAEEEGLNQNNAMANQILAYDEAQQAKERMAEDQAWKRQHAESQLGEQRRYHDMMNSYHQQKLQGNPSAEIPSPMGGNLIPIESKSERLMYSKDKKASGDILHELSSIKKDYEDFRELTKNDLIDPMTPYGIGNVSNKAKDFFGYFSDNQKETNKRKALEAKLGKFAVEIERKIKGGVLSEGMVKRFESKGLLPALTDTPQVFEEKLGNLMEEMEGRYKASDASLRYNAHISPYDLNHQSSNVENNGQIILMRDPNGMEYEIPANEIDEAMNDGLTAIE